MRIVYHIWWFVWRRSLQTKRTALSASKKFKEYYHLVSEYTVYNQSAVAHYDFNMHRCKKLGENKFTKASEQTLDRQQQKLTLYANILILLTDSAYTNINIII